MDKKAQQYKLPGVLPDPKKETATVYTEYIDAIKRAGATEFCRPCFAYVQPGHTCPTWTKQSPRRPPTMKNKPQQPTTVEIEAHVRKLLGLPECDCGQGLYCPEISLNGLDRAEEVLAYLKGVDQDAVVAYLQERWT